MFSLNSRLKKPATILDANRAETAKTLGLCIGPHSTVAPGTYIGRADALQAPTLTLPAGLDPQATYLVICLDLDAPFYMLPVLGPINHWVLPGLKVSSADSRTLTSSMIPIWSYIGPAPPPGAAPHRYSFFLYHQPEGQEAEASIAQFIPPSEPSVWKRMWSSLEEWEGKLGLGEVVASNWFESN